MFDWSQGHVDASIDVPEDNIASQLKIDWENYKVRKLLIYVYFVPYVSP